MAKAVLASQGADAQLYITRHIGELMASGDLLAVSVWRDVRKALVTLQQEMGPAGPHPQAVTSGSGVAQPPKTGG